MSDLNVTPTNHADLAQDPPLPFAEPIPRFFTYAQVAKIFSRTPRTIRLWVREGRLEAIHIGGARLVPEAEIRRVAGECAPPGTSALTNSIKQMEQ